MVSMAEKVRGVICEQLIEVAPALTPPGSDASVKHAPDAALITFISTQVLLPILTGAVSGLITHLATRGSADATARKLAEIDSHLRALVQRESPADDAVVDEIVQRMAELHIDVGELGAAAETNIATKVAAELQRYKLSRATSSRLAPIIVRRALAALSSAVADRA